MAVLDNDGTSFHVNSPAERLASRYTGPVSTTIESLNLNTMVPIRVPMVMSSSAVHMLPETFDVNSPEPNHLGFLPLHSFGVPEGLLRLVPHYKMARPQPL